MSDDRLLAVLPAHFAPPKGYANGVITTGRLLHVGGQVGWEPATGQFHHRDLVGQFGQCLDNILAVVEAAGGTARDIARMTVYVTDLAAYRAAQKALGAVWRPRLGRHFPAMALVGVTGLVEPDAMVEIEAVAVLPEVSP